MPDPGKVSDAETGGGALAGLDPDPLAGVLPGGVASLMGDLARDWQHHTSMTDTLEAITHAAVGAIPGAKYCGVTLVTGRRHVESKAATADVVVQIDDAQYDTGEGPCLTEHIRLHDVARRLTEPE